MTGIAAARAALDAAEEHVAGEDPPPRHIPLSAHDFGQHELCGTDCLLRPPDLDAAEPGPVDEDGEGLADVDDEPPFDQDEDAPQPDADDQP